MSGNSETANGPRVAVDEIMTKIREEIGRRRGPGHETTQYAGLTTSGPQVGEEPTCEKEAGDNFFWKYGLKYARVIKKIPVIRNIAEKYYWQMANRLTSSETAAMFRNKEVEPGPDVNYSGFLAQLKHEGLKGKIKLFIFRFIGFFAWWQAQVNAEFQQELRTQQAKNEEVWNELNKRRKDVKELSDRLATVSRTSSALYQELVIQRAGQRRTLQQMQAYELAFRQAGVPVSQPFSERQPENIYKEDKDSLDKMYAAFEDRFRGTREDIKQRQRIYLPYIEQAGARTGDIPVLDIGCGRGEWLELLKENGYKARGVDLNPYMIERCRELELDIIECDALQYLRIQETNSVVAVTGFHILEHMPLETVVAIFKESLRILRPGGLIIFESPNPENLIVGAFTFYYDPSHVRPYPAGTVRFVAEYTGFVRTGILKLHKYSDFVQVEDSDAFKNTWFYTDMDYAIIAYKKSPSAGGVELP